jgi:hypothetical protein
MHIEINGHKQATTFLKVHTEINGRKQATTFLKVHTEINGRKQETNKAIRSNLTPVMRLKYTS